ncbi:MAG TPA: gamma-glutamylcyclotransferase family protein [Terracidiphilus sp.]|nr:gamma-glutamylcyclotransferase family protein [Terracidiphilus sp.]
MAETKTVFVYGTLKRGCRNHHVLRAADFLGEAWTEPIYLMVNCGSYPGLVHAGPAREGQAIHGELYRVDAPLLAMLDAFEDVPREYTRASIELRNGTPAQSYFYRGDTAHLSLCEAVWMEK